MDSIPRRPLILNRQNGKLAVAGAAHAPTGIELHCPPVPEALEPPKTERYISLCKAAFRAAAETEDDFLFLRSAMEFRALRAAVLALTDICGKTLIAELHTVSEGRMPDGTDLVAAAGVLQRIGVSTLILTAGQPEHLSGALERLAPYVRVSVGAALPAQWLLDGIELTDVEVFVPFPGEDPAAFRDAACRWTGYRTASRDHDDVILAPDGRNAHFIVPTVDISDEIVCDHRLYESLLEAEDEEAAVLKLLLEDEEGIQDLEDDLYMLSRPVCLCAGTPELLEKALRAFYGLAIYDGTWEQEPKVLKYFERKYGLICL